MKKKPVMPDTNDHAVVTAGLTKVFKDFWLREKVTAVADLDLQVNRGEVYGLLGPNGSGKSTTLKMILGLLFPTHGQISVLGKRPTDVRTKKRIGFLPEESYLYPFLNATETLDFYGRLFSQSRSQRRSRTDMLLDMVGLTGVAHRRVGEYSKGMQRRIGLAQALINDPDLLILDEPTVGMDPIGARQFKDLIRTLAARGKTVILSSHLLADVEDVCDRVCILFGGRQRACGRIGDLLARQDRTQITTDALDQATLNKLEAVLTQSGHEMLSVDAPHDRLENLFIRIVAQAHEQKLATGGAGPAGQVAEFLRAGADEGRGVIESLTAAEAVGPAPVTSTEPAPVPQGPAQDVLAELTDQQAKAEEPAEPKAPAAKPQPAQADQSVINELLGSDEGDQKEKG